MNNISQKLNYETITQENTGLEDFKHIYNLSQLKLLECAQHTPGMDIQLDADIYAKEVDLLAIQDYVLNKAANIEITTDNDALLMTKLWLQVIKSKSDMTYSDQLALTLCKYIQRA